MGQWKASQSMLSQEEVHDQKINNFKFGIAQI